MQEKDPSGPRWSVGFGYPSPERVQTPACYAEKSRPGKEQRRPPAPALAHRWLMRPCPLSSQQPGDKISQRKRAIPRLYPGNWEDQALSHILTHCN